MPKLPDIAASARPIPTPSGGVSRYQSPDLGSALAVGDAITSSAKKVGAIMEQEQLRVDTLRAEDSYNQLLQKKQELSLGEGGFIGKKGKAAVTEPLVPNYLGQFDQASKSISETLQSPRAKQMFQRRADGARLQFGDDLMRHLVHEGDVYEEQVFKGGTAAESANVSAHWNEPASVAASVERIRGMVKARADGKGWDAEFTNAQMQQELGNLHESVITQALSNKEYAYAEDWFNKNKGDMDRPTLDRLAPRVESGVQKQLVNGYTEEFLANRDNYGALTSMQKRVMSDKVLDDELKNMLVGRLESRQEILSNRYERAQAQHELGVQRQITALNALTAQGYEPSAEQMQPLVVATKGTAFEPVVKQMIAAADATHRFRLSPPAIQEQAITQAEAMARQDPNKVDIQLLARMKTIHAAQKEALAKDPVTYSVRQGLVAPDDPAAQPIDLTKPATAATGIAARAGLSRSMSHKYGSPFKILTEGEASAVSNYLRTAPATAKREFLGTLVAATKDDRPAYSAILGQIAPDDPVTAVAGMRVGKNPTASELMLRGQEIMNPPKTADGKPAGGKTWPGPKLSDFDRRFRDSERDAFAGRPDARNVHYQATLSVYAALSANEGDADPAVDSKRFDKAFQLAVGNVGKVNDKAVVLPYGMGKSDFEDGLEARLNYLGKSGNLDKSMTPSKLKRMTLEVRGDGKYVLRAGDMGLMDKNGKPVVLDFNTPLPAIPVPAGSELPSDSVRLFK